MTEKENDPKTGEKKFISGVVEGEQIRCWYTTRDQIWRSEYSANLAFLSVAAVCEVIAFGFISDRQF